MASGHQTGRRAGGFSLVELIVVLAVMGMLLSLALPRLTGALAVRSVKNARAATANLYARARIHAIQTGRPTTLQLGSGRVWITAEGASRTDTVGVPIDLVREFGATLQVSGGPVVVNSNGLVRSGTPLTVTFSRAGKADTFQLLGYGQVQ